MNNSSVVTRPGDAKFSVCQDALYPKLSLVDTIYQRSIPWELTSPALFDIISHVLEHILTPDASSDSHIIQFGQNCSLVTSVIRLGDMLQRSPEDLELRTNMAYAATLALNNFTDATYTGGSWACHGIAHAIGCLTDATHGRALAVVMPAFMDACWEADCMRPELGAAFNGICGSSVCLTAGCPLADHLRQVCRRWGLPTTLVELVSGASPELRAEILEMFKKRLLCDIHIAESTILRM